MKYIFDGDDLGDIRFAISPMTEASLSLRAVLRPGQFPAHLSWLRSTQVVREDIDLRLLSGLFNEQGWSPDFLNPIPTGPTTTFEDELAQLRRLPVSTFREQVRAVHHGDLPEAYARRGRASLLAVAAAMEAYWDACIQPSWPRMRALLEADIVYRGRLMVQQGPRAMLASLAPTVELLADGLDIATPTGRHRVEPVAGRGLTLIPTVFTHRASVPTTIGHPPLLLYVARGQGLLWAQTPTPSAGAISEVLGNTRTHLLTLLEAPASSTHLAAHLGVTSSAVNQHLRALHAAGLLTSARYGRSVLYQRSHLADQLLGVRPK